MMGTHHAITGAAAWVAVTSTAPFLPTLGWHPLGSVSVVLGAVVCAGAALLPDADHHNSTIAHSVPVIGKIATRTVRAASGGHRRGTHSLLAAALLLGAVFELNPTGGGSIPAGGDPTLLATATVAAPLAFAVKVLGLVPGWGCAWLLGGALSALISWASPQPWEWLPLCIATGWVVHLAGDFLTTGGLPLLWPIRLKPPRKVTRTPLLRSFWTTGGHFAFPLLGKTGSVREWMLMVPLAGYALAGIGLELLRLVLPLVQVRP